MTSTYISETSQWLEEVVLGLNLCPFAHRPFQRQAIHYCVSKESDIRLIKSVLFEEMARLCNKQRLPATTLIILPKIEGFFEFLDLLDGLNSALEASEYADLFQLASFHPDYQFAGPEPEDRSHYTNRSPYATLHIIADEDMDEAVSSHPDTSTIPATNIERLRSLSEESFQKIRKHSLKT